MSEKLIDEIQILLEKQPLLDIEETEDEYILNGLYKYCLEYNSNIMQGERRVKLCIMKTFLIVYLSCMYMIVRMKWNISILMIMFV